ncbi:GAF domain-containing protein [Desulfurivibrio dismutans]|uniref:GAF domain-containing protein n=1 Tax=Desulfurivibrio dismutans TaxID=1398908 RepID=UPI0023DC7288|nr:GAF domain-containing protein [Desulfurivibrio alkaliphilus]MDF1615767.1 GAF domain-containing protein [Desulfurivibrio alkaliphilus]
MNQQKLYYKLNLIFTLLLLFPVAGFLYFGFQYGFLEDTSVQLVVVVGLVYIFVGYTLMRRLFDNIIAISQTIADKTGIADNSQSELQQIISSFNAIEQRFRQSSERLTQKAHEISTLRELSDLCYVTLDPGEILQLTLERALTLTRADIGSVQLLDQAKQHFVVKASIGLGDFVKINDRIAFETSVGKYAVINKSPLVVEDIEKERRFGRANRSHYGSKSFVIMPIKTIKDVIGVLSLSRRDEAAIFHQEDIEALIPLLSNAAFTYENIRLTNDLEHTREHLQAIRKIFKSLNSSLQNSELLHTILSEIQEVIPFEIAIVLLRDEKRANKLKVIDLLSREPVDISIGTSFSFIR